MEIPYHTKVYFVILSLILTCYYLVPAGTAYWYFYISRFSKGKARHIQDRFPTRESILREIKWSLLSVVIISFIALLVYGGIQRGYTRVYWSIDEYGWPYLVGSSVLAIILYDTYFYWIHRFMHLKSVFPWIHKTHHLSHTPSPWAILAFNPLETVIEFTIYPILIIFIPLHPIALGVFIIHNILLNTAGHTGFELVPKSFFHHRVLRYGLTVTHHEMHHTKTNCNYGIYFNFWDQLMETNHKEYEQTFQGTSPDK